MKKLGIEEFRGLCSLEGILDFKTYNIITERMIDIIWDLEPSKGETETLMTNYVGMVAKYDVMREIEDTLVEENKANLEKLEIIEKLMNEGDSNKKFALWALHTYSIIRVGK